MEGSPVGTTPGGGPPTPGGGPPAPGGGPPTPGGGPPTPGGGPPGRGGKPGGTSLGGFQAGVVVSAASWHPPRPKRPPEANIEAIIL
jgi:hypothetical protein